MTREVGVAPGRLAAWLHGFTDRNGPLVSIQVVGDDTELTTERGGRAVIVGRREPASDLGRLTAALLPAGRAVVVLLRRGGYSVATASYAGPEHEVSASKTGSRYVQGRTAAGGQSQQRFARRRANQAAAVVDSAADAARRVLGDHPSPVDLLVTSGDRPLIDDLLTRPPLSVLGHTSLRHVDAGEPKRAAVDDALRLARSVTIRVTNAKEAAGS